MKIGIYSIGLDGVSYLKAIALELPSYDYELYTDTRQIDLIETEQVIGKGLKELTRRQVGIIVVLEQSHRLVAFERFSNIEIIFSKTPHELKNYLTNNPELEKSLSKNQTRNITLTEHTPKTDLAVSAILGGILIRE